ncbi:MAG: hypothetical protein OXR03_26980 [Rhodospirillaceae bacterium]|nr:hypothetical protein [Rhodospirillaceae bacterium]
MADAPFRNPAELEKIKAVAGTDADGPIVMLNLNRYKDAAGFPDGALYRRYRAALDALLPQVGGKILWHAPAWGQAAGTQAIDEVLAVWYPSHQAFLDMPQQPGAEENYRLRQDCVAEATIHRCPGDRAPLDGLIFYPEEVSAIGFRRHRRPPPTSVLPFKGEEELDSGLSGFPSPLRGEG